MEEESSVLKLIMEKGPREGETLEFRPGSVIRIGRVVRGNTFAVKDVGISSKHLSIVSKSSKWLITDLDSSNGTILNGSQLPPLDPFDLADGDTIKVGECTSIKVVIEAHGGANWLRRNPRRGAMKEEESSVVENRELKADLALIGGDSALVLGIGGELGNSVEVVEVNKRGRGRPRRAKVMASESLERVFEVENLERLDNVGPIEPKQGRQVSTRRTRSSKNKENSVVDENGCREVETSAQIVGKMTRGGTRRRNKPLESFENEVLVEKEQAKDSNLVQEDSLKVQEDLPNEEMGAVQTEVLEDKEVAERANSEQQGRENLEAGLGNEGSGVDARDGPDLEKMTLGEWFDYLEEYLPNQIHKETEEMILRMNQRAEQFHEFVLKQKNDEEKGKLPVS